MKIEIYEEVKKAFKDALSEWYEENKSSLLFAHSKDENGGNLLTINQFTKKHPFITAAGLRYKLFSREYNGMDKCISKAGRKVLIKEKEMLDWYNNPPKEANWTYNRKLYGHDK